MKVILESTDKIVEVNGVPARIWEGQTESGVPCFAMITKIGVHVDQDASQFEKELKECKAPTFSNDAVTRSMWFLD